MSQFKLVNVILLTTVLFIPFLVNAEKVVLQNGVDEYAGCEDAWFEEGKNINGASNDLSIMKYFCEV